MSTTRRPFRFVAASIFALTPTLLVAQTFSFDHIDFWVGTGANRAAIVIDWSDHSTEPPALAWGYRWDGAATGRDMLMAIVAADERLFAKLGGAPASPVALFGLGYDANDDGQFALDDDPGFDADGFVFTGPADGNVSVDPADYYAEGWFTGFWHYGVASTNPYDGGNWSDTPLGMAGRVLANGAWDSWTFSPTFNFASFAENPQAAAPDMTSPSLPGDFDRSGRVDAADYQLWKSQFGSMSAPALDANANGIVDAADYTIWRDNLGATNSSSFGRSLAVPEPSTVGLVFGSLCNWWLFITRKRKEWFS